MWLTSVALESSGDTSGLCSGSTTNKIMNARLNRVAFSTVFDAMVELLNNKYGSNSFDDSMCIFIIGITKLKPIDSLEVSSEIKSGVSLFLSCCDGYSKQKFKELVQNQYFGKLCAVFGDDTLKSQLQSYSK